jgi:hypothetical protein
VLNKGATFSFVPVAGSGGFHQHVGACDRWLPWYCLGQKAGSLERWAGAFVAGVVAAAWLTASKPVPWWTHRSSLARWYPLAGVQPLR